MPKISRRELLAAAAAYGAVAAWAKAFARPSQERWVERRDSFPEGVASGDPDYHSVILWTRRQYPDNRQTGRLVVEVAEDSEFRQVVATTHTNVRADSDFTARVLVGGLKPQTKYWYRFTDSEGNGSRIGRTFTAPRENDTVTARFAVLCCQNVNQGAQNAYRRLIHEDRQAAPENKLAFILHLGDFIYETVWYPEDSPNGKYYGRRLRDVVRYENGEKITNFHVPTTTADYRAVHRAYLHDPDIQDARAWLPFVAMWDNHDFSWQGWQGIERFLGPNVPAQTRKVAANQAWFEYHPGRWSRPLDQFSAPHVVDTPVTQFDSDGLGVEPNNLAAIRSLTGYRAFRWGRHLELFITDQHSYHSQDDLMGRDEAKAFINQALPFFFPEEALLILDGGRTWNGGNPLSEIGDWNQPVENFRKSEPPVTVLGAEQKAWFLKKLKDSRATWKLWGNTNATLDMRADLQNLPADFPRWPSSGYGVVRWGGAGSDWSNAFTERGEIYDFVAKEKITGFATIAGDRHSFWAGLAAKSLPPRDFNPVGIAFVTGSISTPSFQEIMEYLPKNYPLRPLFWSDTGGSGIVEGTINLMVRHGVQTALAYAHDGDLRKALSLSNPNNAPHLSFVDMGGHGYSVVRAGVDILEVEFVCIPRPFERSDQEDGGPLRYRVLHRAKLWGNGERPVLEQRIIEGDVSLSV